MSVADRPGVRRAVAGSAIVRGIAHTAHALTVPGARFSAWLDASVALKPVTALSSPNLDDTASIAARSWLVRAIDRAVERVRAAWDTSTARAWLDAVHPRRYATDQYVRLTGWVGLSATLTHVVLAGPLAIMASASALGWTAALVLSVACIGRPYAVIAAWRTSRLHRHLPGPTRRTSTGPRQP